MVHSQFDSKELDWARVINLYSNSGHEQYGVMVARNSDLAVDYSEAIGGPGPPGKVSQILISAAAPVDSRVVAHELLHACNVWHHGDDDEVVTWTKAGLRNDQINEYLGRCDRTTPVKAFDRNGLPIEPSALHQDGSDVRISLQHGEHSGAEDCLMRYACRGNLARLDSSSPKTVRRMADAGQTGIVMCRSQRGTGINATELGWGDSAAGRGNCFGQIHVNDRTPAQDRNIERKPCAQNPP